MYIYTKYHQFNENLNGETILFRGDSNYIKNFDPNKFDNTAIYGLGLYLTDNKNVAYTYTLKGSDNESVIARLYPSTDDYTYAKLCFIIEKLVNQVNGTYFDEEMLHDKVYDKLKTYHTYKKDMITRYDNGIELFWLSDDYIAKLKKDELKYSECVEDVPYYTERIKNYKEEYKEIRVKFGKYIDNATEYFDNHENEYEFIYDGSEEWKVVNKGDNKGYVSEFSIKNNVLNHMYDANILVNNDVKSILKSMINRYNKSSKIQNYINTHKYIDKSRYTYLGIVRYSTHNNNYPFTLANFLYNFSDFRYGETALERKDWEFFINEMKKLGYKGIRYDGGEHLNSNIKHNAYVIWDLSDIKRVS